MRKNRFMFFIAFLITPYGWIAAGDVQRVFVHIILSQEQIFQEGDDRHQRYADLWNSCNASFPVVLDVSNDEGLSKEHGVDNGVPVVWINTTSDNWSDHERERLFKDLSDSNAQLFFQNAKTCIECVLVSKDRTKIPVIYKNGAFWDIRVDSVENLKNRFSHEALESLNGLYFVKTNPALCLHVVSELTFNNLQYQCVRELLKLLTGKKDPSANEILEFSQEFEVVLQDKKENSFGKTKLKDLGDLKLYATFLCKEKGERGKSNQVVTFDDVYKVITKSANKVKGVLFPDGDSAR